MGLEQVAYTVLSEFKFEIGGALFQTKTLGGAVDKLSDSADRALNSFQTLGLGIVGSFGLGAGGILGTLGKAVQVADKFRLSQLAFANILSTNRQNLVGPIDTFNERLMVSESIMKRIASSGVEFGLDETTMLDTTKLLAAALIPKGLAGTNLTTAIDLARGTLKSAPTLGLDAADVQGQLLRAVSGGASSGDPLFRALVNDTSAFKDQFKGASSTKTTQAFNTLPAVKRVELLRKALLQFGSDTDVLTGNVGTLNGQMTILGNLIGGPISSVLRPLGEKLLPAIVQVFMGFNRMLNKEGREILSNVAELAGPWLKDPKKFIENLLTLKELSRDIQLGAKTGGIALLVGTVMNFFGISIIGALGAVLGKGLGLAFRVPAMLIANFSTVLTVLGFVFRFVWFAATKLLAPLAVLATFFQIISRAQAKAKIADSLALPGILAEASGMLARFQVAVQNIFLPFNMMIDMFAGWISWLFEVNTMWEVVSPVLEFTVSLFEKLGDQMVAFTAILSGSFAALFSLISDFQNRNFSDMMFNAGNAFDQEFSRFMDAHLQKVKTGDAVVNQTTNIGTVEIRNQFKENLEPDRIAFVLKEQLLKTAQNPTAPRGKRSVSLGGAF